MARKKVMTVAELVSKAGKVGGKRRMASMTAEERSEFARQGGARGRRGAGEEALRQKA